MIDKNEQRFTVQTDAKDPNGKMKVEGAADNQLFIDYMSYLSKKRPESEALKKK